MAKIPEMRTWEQAWEHATTGSAGFYSHSLPYDHFTTSVEQSALAHDLLPYLRTALIQGPIRFIDVGAGTGLLAQQISGLLTPSERERTSLICLDVRPRPAYLSATIDWIQGDARQTITQIPAGHTVLVAHEFFDDIPCALAEVDSDGVTHSVVADHTHFTPTLGIALDPTSPEFDWLKKWWPATRPFMRCEVGTTRDACWRDLTKIVTSGYAIAIDYAHMRTDRVRGVWDGGTLTGYRAGQTLTPQATGEMNITAHVALDSLADASSGTPHITMLQRGPTPDFWWLIAAYAIEFPLPAKMTP